MKKEFIITVVENSEEGCFECDFQFGDNCTLPYDCGIHDGSAHLKIKEKD